MYRSYPIGAISVLIVAIGILAVPAPAQDSTSVVGLTLFQKDADSEYGQSLVPGSPAGTQVYLRVTLAGRTLLKIEDEGTEVSMNDSTGAALDVDEDSNFGFFASISEDRQSVVLPFQSENLPSAGATSISVKGSIACSCGANPKTETIEVNLAVDEELTLGPVTATVVQVEEGFEPDTQRIELESKTSFDQLESLVFMDGAGNVIETSDSGSGSFGFGGEMTYSKSFQINDTADRVRSAKITFFQQVETITVPIDATVGLNLEPSR